MSATDTTQTFSILNITESRMKHRPHSNNRRHAAPKTKRQARWDALMRILILDPAPEYEVYDTDGVEPSIRWFNAILDSAYRPLRFITRTQLGQPIGVPGAVVGFVLALACFASSIWVPYMALEMQATVESLALQSVVGLAVLVSLVWLASKLRRKLDRPNGHLAVHTRRFLIETEEEWR